MASRQFGTLPDGFLKQYLSVVELLLLQRVYSLEGKRFCLRQARPECVQRLQFIQFFLCRASFALSPQRDPQVVTCLFKIRLQRNRPPEGRDRPSQVARSL